MENPVIVHNKLAGQILLARESRKQTYCITWNIIITQRPTTASAEFTLIDSNIALSVEEGVASGRRRRYEMAVRLFMILVFCCWFVKEETIAIQQSVQMR